MARRATSMCGGMRAQVGGGTNNSDPDGRTSATVMAVESTLVRVAGVARRSLKGAGTATVAGGTQSYNASDGANPATTANHPLYARVYFMVDALPTATIKIFQWFDSTGSGYVSVRLTAAGNLQLWNDRAGTQIGADSTLAVALNTWYMIEVKISASGAATASSTVEGRYWTSDTGVATVWATTTTANLGTLQPGQISIGWAAAPGTNANIYFVDFALNDDQGADQNGYPGPGTVWILYPSSDNAIGGWTNGTGGATNLFDAVNGPAATGGKSSASATATSQAKSVTNSATDNLDVNCDSYNTGQVPSGDTIKLVVPVVNMGPGTAVAIDGSIGIVSNPAAADATLTGVATAVGAYATGWKWKVGTYVYSPTVTRATSPVLRIGKRTATASELDAQMALILVESTPTTTPVGSSRALPYTVATPVGASVALPSSVTGPVGASRAQPYTLRTALGASRTQPYSVRAFVGRSDALPYNMTAYLGVSLALPYGSAHAPTNLSLPVIIGVPEVGNTLSVIPGTWNP